SVLSYLHKSLVAYRNGLPAPSLLVSGGTVSTVIPSLSQPVGCFREEWLYALSLTLSGGLSDKPGCREPGRWPKMEPVREGAIASPFPGTTEGEKTAQQPISPQQCVTSWSENMTKHNGLRPPGLRLEELEPRLTPAGPVGTLESFDTTVPGTLPAGWSQWSSTAPTPFAVSSAPPPSVPNPLAATPPAASGMNARSWANPAQPANVQAQSAVYLNSPIPAEILARGTALDTAAPSYYAASVTQGLG